MSEVPLCGPGTRRPAWVYALPRTTLVRVLRAVHCACSSGRYEPGMPCLCLLVECTESHTLDTRLPRRDHLLPPSPLPLSTRTAVYLRKRTSQERRRRASREDEGQTMQAGLSETFCFSSQHGNSEQVCDKKSVYHPPEPPAPHFARVFGGGGAQTPAGRRVASPLARSDDLPAERRADCLDRSREAGVRRMPSSRRERRGPVAAGEERSEW